MDLNPTYERPYPPESLRGATLGFARAEDIEQLIRVDFVGRGGLFFDPEHGHLNGARIGVLWAASKHVDKGSEKAGTAQLLRPPQAKWGDAMRHAYLRQFFGIDLPHFLIILSREACLSYDDKQFFALLDHELCHCSTAKDEYGCPRFNEQTGEPVWCLRPHESEQFSGTVERWGAAASGTTGIVLAGLKKPKFSWVPGTDLDVRKACGVT